MHVRRRQLSSCIMTFMTWCVPLPANNIARRFLKNFFKSQNIRGSFILCSCEVILEKFWCHSVKWKKRECLFLIDDIAPFRYRQRILSNKSKLTIDITWHEGSVTSVRVNVQHTCHLQASQSKSILGLSVSPLVWFQTYQMKNCDIFKFLIQISMQV